MERLKRFAHLERKSLPQADVDSIPKDQEITLFERAHRPTYESVIPENSPLPNPFIAGYLAEDARRQRQAEHETGE